MATLEDEGFVEGDAGSESADAPGAVPSDTDAAPAAERIQSQKSTFDSTAVMDAPVHRRSDKTSRVRESRAAFAKAIVEAKSANTETAAAAKTTVADEYDPEAEEAAAPPAPPKPSSAPPTKPSSELPAQAAATPPAPSLDPEVRKLREQLKAEREEFERTRAAHMAELEKAKAPAAAVQSDALDYEAYVDSSARAYRTWMEHMRGEKFASEDEFRAEARDFITVLSRDVMGVPLTPDESNGLESRMARKAVRVSKTVATRREQQRAEQAERERAEAATKAEKERVELEWTKAGETLTQHFTTQGEAKSAYPWLAAEDNPGSIVVDVIRAALEKDGTQLSWQEASKKANEFLQGEYKKAYEKRQALLSNAPPAPAAAPAKKAAPPAPTAPPVAPRAAETPTKYSKEKHLQASLAKFRTAFQPGDK